MKKTVSIFICAVIMLSVVSPAAFALKADSPFSIDAYTFFDLYDMTYEEKYELLTQYKNTYAPFGITADSDPYTIQPMWSSGNTYLGGEHEYETHEMVTLEAILEVATYLNEHGDGAAACFGDATSVLIFSLNLAVASALPDRIGSGGIGIAFAGHFYNPETGKNYLGQTSPTAKTNAVSEYTDAISNLSNQYALVSSENMEGIEKIGCMLHYIQDACEPHHSSNVIANPFNNSHGEFEDYVQDNLSSFIDCQYAFLQMEAFSSMTVGETVDLAAIISHQHINSVNDVDDKSKWASVADICIDTATFYSATMLYKVLYICEFI